MAMNSEAPKHGGSGGGELEKRVAGVESRLGVIEKTMVTGEVFQRETGVLRDEMHVSFGALRDEMHVSFGALRDEMHVTLGALRDETHRSLAALRDEMHVSLGTLRDEMRAGLGALRQEMHGELGALRVEIAKIPFETFKWLLAAAGLAAAIATAVYNIWFRDS